MGKKERSFYYDNIKGFLIILVFWGHVLKLYEDKSTLKVLCDFIYSFHMPAFLLVSGYFSKKIRSIENNFETILIPTIFFELMSFLIHYITGKGDGNYPFMTPIFAYWYMWVLFFYRMILPILCRIKYNVLLSLIIAVGVGFNALIGEYMTISRMLVFMPFFLTGYYMQSDTIEKIRKKGSLAIVDIGIAFAITFIIYKVNIEHNWTYNEPYNSYYGAYGRILGFTIAIFMILAILRIMPQKYTFLTSIGENSAIVYFLHFYIVAIIKLYSGLADDLLGIITMSLIVAIVGSKLLACSLMRKYYDAITKVWKKCLIKTDYEKF